MIEDWRIDYNWNRPHSALGQQAPVKYAVNLGEGTPQTGPDDVVPGNWTGVVRVWAPCLSEHCSGGDYE